MVCLHGFTGSWRVWELVSGGASVTTTCWCRRCPATSAGPRSASASPATRFSTRSSGCSTRRASRPRTCRQLGGRYIALRLAQRGRARSVVALAPADGWVHDDDTLEPTRVRYTEWQKAFRALAGYPDPIVRTRECRQRVTSAMTARVEHIPPELIVHVLNATAFCPCTQPLIDTALCEGYALDAERITCPVRSYEARRTRSCRGRRRPRATGTSGCRTPTGSSSTASATARSSTSRSRRRSSSSASPAAEFGWRVGLARTWVG